MKLMPNKKQDSKVDSNIPAGNNKETTPKPITLEDLPQHLERLRTVSAAAAKLFALVGEHIISVSSIVPVQKGHKALDELRGQAKAHRDGLPIAFDPLREKIDVLKDGFWEKNCEVIEATIRKYIEQKVKERVAVEVEKAIKRYCDHVENNEENNRKLRAIMDLSYARADNSLLRSKYLNERVSWTGEDPGISFGDLVLASESRLPSLASSLGLSPGKDDSQVSILDQTFRHLGINYRPIPSRTGILLMPSATNLG